MSAQQQVSNPYTALWVYPVCEQLLSIFKYVYDNYEKGQVATTRKWVAPVTMRIEDVPTSYAHKFSFKPLELKYLCDILLRIEPSSMVVADLCKLRDNIKKTGILKAGGRYEVTLILRKSEYDLIIKTLLKAKTGQAQKLTEIIEENKDKGKDLFEM